MASLRVFNILRTGLTSEKHFLQDLKKELIILSQQDENAAHTRRDLHIRTRVTHFFLNYFTNTFDRLIKFNK